MTKEETKQILQILRLNYPNSFKNLSDKDTYDFLDLWVQAFHEDDVKIVVMAVKSIIYTDTREFYPNIAQVKKEMYKITHHDTLNEYEAWTYVLNALKESRWSSKEEFEKLPLEVQKAVGSPSNLEEWAWIDNVDTLNGVIASNFYKSYRKTKDDDFKLFALPNNIKQVLKLEEKKNMFIENASNSKLK